MSNRTSLLLLIVGILIMVAGLIVLVVRGDGAGGYSLLAIGGTVFAISGVDTSRRQRAPKKVC